MAFSILSPDAETNWTVVRKSSACPQCWVWSPGYFIGPGFLTPVLQIGVECVLESVLLHHILRKLYLRVPFFSGVFFLFFCFLDHTVLFSDRILWFVFTCSAGGYGPFHIYNHLCQSALNFFFQQHLCFTLGDVRVGFGSRLPAFTSLSAACSICTGIHFAVL